MEGEKGEGKGKYTGRNSGRGGVVEERGNGAEPEPGSPARAAPFLFEKKTKKKLFFGNVQILCWRSLSRPERPRVSGDRGGGCGRSGLPSAPGLGGLARSPCGPRPLRWPGLAAGKERPAGRPGGARAPGSRLGCSCCLPSCSPRLPVTLAGSHFFAPVLRGPPTFLGVGRGGGFSGATRRAEERG